MKTLIGIVTFGNTDFTRLALKSISETVENDYEVFLVIGKPGDNDTISLANENKINFIAHGSNMGFPASVNDIYDMGWIYGDYDNIIIMGNDVIAYPYAIDSLIEVAKDTEYEWICSREFSVKALCDSYPEAKKYFTGSDYIFKDFDEKPWELARIEKSPIETDNAGLSDVHNLCLYKKSVFDKIGYIDVNFFPAYYEDNDYARRAVNYGIKSCTVMNSVYFHFWSRTMKQGSGGSNSHFFTNNRSFYKTKWGGDFGQESYTIPFNGNPYTLVDDVILPASLKIDLRIDEEKIIEYWRNK